MREAELKDVLAAADHYEVRVAAAFLRGAVKLRRKLLPIEKLADAISMRSKITLPVEDSLEEMVDILLAAEAKGVRIGQQKLEETLS